MKKYEMLKDKIEMEGHTLYRIKALKNFGDVKAGDLGGYIEKTENLLQEGDCWVYDEACVYGDAFVFGNAEVSDSACIYDNARVFGEARVFAKARVFGEACVYGDACIYGNTFVFGDAHVFGDARFSSNGQINKDNDYLCVMNIGGSNDTTTFFKTQDNKIGVACGCFTGTIDEFLQAVNKAHGENKHAKAYKLACMLARVQILEV